MTEPAASGRPTGGGGGSRSSTAIRHGFEPYNPGSRAAARRAAGGSGGHDTARGRGLWESDRESGRPSRAEKEWKHDMFEDASRVAAQQQQQSARGGGGGANGGAGVRMKGRGVSRAFGVISASDSAGPSPAAGAGAGAASNGSGGAVEAAVVPSGEKYEDISRKVEEEVVAKLARAQMMGMMLKAHKEKQQQQQAQGTDKRRGGVGNGGGSSTRRSRAGNSSNRQNRGGGPSPVPIAGLAGAPARRRVNIPAAAAAEESPPIGKTPPGQGRSVPGTSGEGETPRTGGILKVSPEVLHSKGGTETRTSSDATTALPASLAPVAISRDSQSDISTQDDTLGSDPGAMSVEEAYAIVGKLEQRHKAMAEELRKDIGLVQPGRIRPEDISAARDVSPGSAALCRRVSRLRVALSRALGSLVLRDPALSLRKRLPNRLWMAHYRELEMIQHRLRQLGQARQQQQQQETLRARLLVLVEEAERDIGGMVESVEQQIAEASSKSSRLRLSSSSSSSSPASLSPPASSVSPIDGIKTNLDEVRDLDAANADAASEGLGEHQGCLGNARMADGSGEPQREMERSSSCDGEDEEDGVVSQEDFGRRQALQAFLTNLGDLSRYRGLYAEAAPRGGERAASWLKADELYRRALEVDPSSGKVWNQIAVLASCRQDNLKAFYAYLRGVCAGVPYPPGRESLLVLHENCKARLSTVKEATALDALEFEEHRARFRLYLLGACGTCLSRVDLGAFDGYLALSGRHMVSCVQLYLMKVDADRGAATVGEDSLEETLARAIVLCICTASASFDAWRARDTGDGSWTTDAATSRAVRLCMSLAASLSGLHRKTSRRGWERVTAAGLSVFLDWLTCRPQFGEGARGTRGGLEEFQYVMACVVEFANGIFRSTGGGKGNGGERDVDPDSMLWEDEECRGLPALSVVTERRWAKHNRKKSSVHRKLSNTNGNAAPPLSMETPSEGPVNIKEVGGSRGSRSRGAKGRDRKRGAGGARLGSSADETRFMTGEKNEGDAQMDPWKIRLARIRRQVEFCVERGWIARGNRPGTYTLPKPPPSGSIRQGSPRGAEAYSDRQRGGCGGRPSARQRDHISAASAMASGKRDQPRTEHVTAPPLPQHPSLPGSSSLASASPSPAPAGGGRFVAENGSGNFGNGGSAASATGHAANTVEAQVNAQASVQATAQAEAAAVAQALSSLHLEMQAQEHGNGISSGHADMQNHGTVASMAAPPNYAPPGFPESSGVVYPGTVMSVPGNTVGGENYVIGAAKVEGMERNIPEGPNGGYGVGGGVVRVGGESDSNPLPESLLGIVLAGLGSAEENLCAYCFATLGTGALECSTCGTPVPVPAATDGSAEVVASGGAAVTTSGSPRAVGGEDDRDDQGVAERPTAILPAGVLAVNNLEEVIASSSQRPKSPMTGPSGGGQRGSGRSRSYNSHKNDSSIASMARAGLGDGGGRLGSGPSSGAGGSKMFGWPRGAPRPSALPLVVIDVPNVAMRHGLNKKFSCKGVQMAVEYFRTAGHRVVGFLPDYHLDQQRTNGLERAKKLGVAEVKASRLPDDIPLLQRLVDDGVIVATPPQDYDDSYCIKYAMARGGYLVTNDLYRDHIKAKGTEGRKKADAARRWIKSHSISYTFVGDEFFPNPDFSFNQDQQGGGGTGAP